MCHGRRRGGLPAAVMMKDKNYTVVVLEKKDDIGGHCNTETFLAPPGQINFVDIGVVTYINTTLVEEIGLGQFVINFDAFINRFATVVPFVSSSSQPFIANFRKNGSPQPNNLTASYAYDEAFEELFLIVAEKFPWLSNASYPDPIPEELINQTFSEWVINNNLEALTEPGGLLYLLVTGGGFPEWNRLTALYGILSLSASILSIAEDPATFTAVSGGCIQYFNGMRDYLGHHNVIVNATVLNGQREEGQPIVLTGSRRIGNRDEDFQYECGILITAFPQTMHALEKFLDLDSVEKEVFKHVRTRPCFVAEFNVNGSIADQLPLQMANSDPENLFKQPKLPSIVHMSRNLTYGPAFGQLASNRQISQAIMENIAKQNLQHISVDPSVFSASLGKVIRHVLQPFFTKQRLLKKGISPYTELANIQGHRNTYHVGALISFSASHVVVNAVANLLASIPPKTG
jgi:hypothetical protein